MYDKILVFANEPSAIEEILSCARNVAAEVILVTCGKCTPGADRIYRYPKETSIAVLMPKLSELINEIKPKAVICESGIDGKLFAGFAASALHTSPLCDVSEVEFQAGHVVAKRLAYGGTAVKTEKAALPAVLVASSGFFDGDTAEGKGECSEIDAVESAVKLLNISEETTVSPTNLAAAKRVVGVGRGLSSADNIPSVEKLASLIDAEVGCTRPVAEEEHWYTKDRYIGVSGCMLKPSVYLAIGISGQVQHMVGVNQSGTIFAIDRNEQAPIFAQADYCLQGDVNTVLPKLIELLS